MQAANDSKPISLETEETRKLSNFARAAQGLPPLPQKERLPPKGWGEMGALATNRGMILSR